MAKSLASEAEVPDRTTSWIVRPPGDATGTLAFAGLVFGVVVAALSVVALLAHKRGWPGGVPPAQHERTF